MFVSKVFHKIASKLNYVQNIDYRDYKPKNFQPDAYDIGKIYHLNNWLLENSPKPKDMF